MNIFPFNLSRMISSENSIISAEILSFISDYKGIIFIAIVLINIIIYLTVGFYLKKIIYVQYRSIYPLHQKISLNFRNTLVAITILISVKLFLDSENVYYAVVNKTVAIFLSIVIVFLINSIIDLLFYFIDRKVSNIKFDIILLNVLERLCKILIFAIGIIYILELLGIKMDSVIAGAGIGAVAIGLAAKETIANFFGSLTILLDKPFQLGDRINIDDADGIVEHVGLRSTRIRTSADSVVIIPNGILINTKIDNFHRRNYFRFKETVRLEYNTTIEQIEVFCQRIRDLLTNYPRVKHDSILVYFNQMDESSLNILVSFFINVNTWPMELEERHNFFCDLMKLAKELNINFAYPTRSIQMIDN